MSAHDLWPQIKAACRRWPWRQVVFAAIFTAGLIFRIAPIADDPLHPDECLYASWALSIADGHDPWLRTQVVDKPPLFPYLLAGWSQLVGTSPAALRSIGLLAAACSLFFLFRLSNHLYGNGAAFTALTFAALSPLAIALDATALTDQPAIALALLASVLAARSKAGWAGFVLALATATKPQALAYAPLMLALLLQTKPSKNWPLSVMGGFVAVMVAVLAWNGWRGARIGFAAAAVQNIGGLSFNAWNLQLPVQWVELLRWLWGEPLALALWAAVIFLSIILAIKAPATADLPASGAAASLLFYVAGNLALGIPVWDRYALMALPFCVVLLAWATWRCLYLFKTSSRTWATAALICTLLLLLMRPARAAANSQLPLGDTSYWQGIETVAAYLRGQVPGRATVLYQDYGWHLRYYLYRFPQDFRWFKDENDLLRLAKQGTPMYILLPADMHGEAHLHVLQAAGFTTNIIHTAYRTDGSPSMRLYRLCAEEQF